MSVQRQVPVSWNSYAVVPDVAMTGYDSNVTTIATGAATYQVARGSVVADARGARQETMLFRPGTQATMLLPDGTTQALSSLSVRATEYTVGPDGLEAMPAPLPPESGYTYCVELSADEAVAAGATTVRFDRPVITYIDEFVGIPVGTNVPNGYYDRERGVWVPAPDGRVVMIMTIVEGRAYLDVTGDGAIDDPTVLEPLGITTAEREQLGGLYGVGKKLWRVPVDHFTPFDHNVALVPISPWDSPDSNGGPPAWWIPASGCKTECGSIIGVEDQTLGEQVGVTGTPFALSYTSRRVPGFRPGYRVVVPLTGATAPQGAKRVELSVMIAGRRFLHSTTNAPNQKYEFEWDGLDIYDRPVQGTMMADISLTYTYDGIYIFPGRTYSFADFSKLSREQGWPAPTGSEFEARRSVSWQVPVGSWKSTGTGLGAWTLDVHHTYDPVSRVLQMGDGSHRTAEAIGPVVHTVAGTGQCCGSSGDDEPATKATLGFPTSIAIGADGSLYIGEQGRIRRVGRDGIIRTVAGDGSSGQFEDGRDGLVDGPAKNVPVAPQDLSIAADGSIYVTEGARVRRFSGGRMTTVAGSGRYGSSGDDGSAANAGFSPKGIVAVRDGSLLVVDDASSSSARLRRVNTAGQVTTIAGGNPVDEWSSTPPAGRAVDAVLRNMTAVASGNAGNIYLAGPNESSRRITPDGNIDTFGPSDGSYSTDFYGTVRPLAVDKEEQVHSDTQYAKPNGEIVRFVGGGPDGREGALALGASIGPVRDMAIGPDGARYVLEYWIPRVRRVDPSLPGLGANDFIVPSTDGSEEYVFNDEGRHLQTRDAVTGVIRYRFEYDGEKRLLRVIDVDDEVTTIERDANGNPTAIIAPGGQRSALTVNGDGYLTQIANPAGEAIQFTYWSDGLLKTFTDPMLHSSTFTYDSRGRLIRDADAAGGHVVLSRSGTDASYSVTTTSGENRTRSYSVTSQTNGTVHRTATNAAGLTVSSSRTSAGATTTTLPGGVLVTGIETADPRFGMQAPIESGTVRTPSGRTMTVESTRTELRATPNGIQSALLGVEWQTRVGTRNFSRSLDVASRTLTSTSATGRVSQSIFDSRDRLTNVLMPGLEPFGLQYDSRGRLIQASQGSRVSTYEYDSRSRVVSVTDPLDRSVTFTYDDADRVTRQTMMPAGRFIDFTYDANGNLTSVTPPSRPQHQFTFTNVDLTERYTPPPVVNGGVTFYEHNQDRQITLVTRPDSKTIAFGYDTGGRMSTLTIGRGAIRFAYFASTGDLESIETPEGNAIHYLFDGSLLMSAEWTGVVNGSIFWNYDHSFRVSSETVACTSPTTAACAPVGYSFDDDGLLLSAGALNLQRRADNGLMTGTTLGSIADEWTYNEFGEPLSYSASYVGTPMFAQQYTRDDLGRIAQRIETVGATSVTTDYAYDNSGRLHEVKTDGTMTASYTYDENGNRLTKTGPSGPESATIDDQDRLLTYNEVLYQYTANGQLHSRTDPLGTTTFDYDELGNLLEVVLADGRTIEYVLDAKNRRIGKTIDGVLVRRWLYANKLAPSAELDGDGNVTARYIYGTRPNVPDLIVQGDTTYRMITDYLGSPRLVVNAATGEIAQKMEYDEFGNVVSDTNPGWQPFGFAGGLYDAETALVRFGARDYDARVGRWTAKDPIGFGGGDGNLYGYVDNDPINLIDPSGLRSLTRCEKSLLEPYIPKVDLDNADIHDGKVPKYLPKRMAGITRGNDIYFRPGAYVPGTAEGLGVLAHELVHVGQYREGMNWAKYLWSVRKGYAEDSKYERPAYDLEDKVYDELKDKFVFDELRKLLDCACGN